MSEQLQSTRDSLALLQRQDILTEVSMERERQDALWGREFDDKNTANDWVAYITHYVSKGAYSGLHDKYRPSSFRAHLVKVAALAVAAIETYDRNGGFAPRHYDTR